MNELDATIASFRERHGLRACIGLSGSADPQEGAELAVEGFLWSLKGTGIAVVTSGTKQGVPHAAFRVAKNLGIPVIRVFPVCARERGHLIEEPADLEVEIPPRVGMSMWGDESEVFVKLSDAFLFVGGSAGTLVEIAHWAKLNKTRAARKQPLIPGVPIALGEGWSDWMSREGHRVFSEFYDQAAPTYSVGSGLKAAEWLCKRLSLTTEAKD